MSDGPEDVGSLGEEAARLFGVLGEWAREHSQDVDQHLATGAPECTWCPVCRTVHAVRTANPEVRAQLIGAAQSLLQAASGLLAAASQPPSERPSSVQRIDLDDDAPDDPEEG